MADSKKYYYLKLKDNFFDSDEIKILESMDNGYKYSNILLKMYLKSIKRDGLLIFNERIPYNAKMIATVTGHNINDVKAALALFQDLRLMDVLSNGAIYMLDIQNYIGKSSTEGDRKREYRAKIKEDKERLGEIETAENEGIIQLEDKCPTSMGQMSDNRPPEIEIELEKDIEKDIDIEIKTYSPVDTVPVTAKAEQYPNIYKQTIDYLNEKANTSYRATTKKTQQLIRCRQKEGFNLNDFKIVIDKKTKEWGKESSMVKYLRPETLFGTKFEGYLNQKEELDRMQLLHNKFEEIRNESNMEIF